MTGFDLRGRTALVTGASGGLGAHFARTLAAHGAAVILAARRTGALAAVAEQIHAEGGECRALELNVADEASIAGAAPELRGVDILVNNAGIARGATALRLAAEDWDAVVDTNLKGAFLLSQLSARAMRERGSGGSIINIASILGLRQAPGVLPYAVSKAGLIQMTRVLALEWARYGIRVNAIAPGYFETENNAEFFAGSAGKAMLERIPQQRLGRFAELDGPLLLLASPLSSYMTGATIEVDGGHLASPL